jgi:hypothetical protein
MEGKAIRRLFVIFPIVICLFIFALSVNPSVSYACKCVEENSVEKELKLSNTVFKGKIIEITRDKHSRRILFEVSTIWKGPSKSQIVLKDESSSCSIDFTKGQKYLVYAKTYGNDVLTTHICDRTVELKIAENDLLLLGEGRAPAEIVNPENDLKPFNVILWSSIIIIPVLMVIFLMRKKRMTK